LKKTSQRTLSFFTVATGPTAAIHLKKDDFLSEEWGAPPASTRPNTSASWKTSFYEAEALLPSSLKLECFIESLDCSEPPILWGW
jgi:hypothetical protein